MPRRVICFRYLNHPDINRTEAIELIRFLNQPMLGIQIKELRTALKAAGQVKELMEVVRRLRNLVSDVAASTYG